MTDGLFDDLMASDEESFQKILLALLDEENIAMKTEIQRPLNLTRLDVLAVWLESENLPNSAKVIQTFISKYLVYMVSNKRQSRKEVIEALTEGLKEDRTMAEKLATKSEEKQ